MIRPDTTTGVDGWDNTPLGELTKKKPDEPPPLNRWEKLTTAFDKRYDAIIDRRGNVPDPMMIADEIIKTMREDGWEITPAEEERLRRPPEIEI